MESDWQEVVRIPAVPPSQVVGYSTVPPALAFDANQELLWVGNEQGRVTSYYSPELRKYTSYRGHDHPLLPGDDSVRNIQVNDRGVISLAARSLHFSIRRGLAQWNIKHGGFHNLSGFAYTNRGTSEILVGGSQSSMFTVNVDRGTVIGEYPTEDDIKVMKRNPRAIVYGTGKGDVKLLDMNTFKVVKEFPQAHGSTISDLDTQGNTILTCGYSPRQGTYHLDTLVKVYDLRTNRALAPVGFPSGAAFARMHPKLSAAAIVASQAGQIQVVDIENPAAIKLYHANVTSYITAMELAPSGDALALMDADGYLQLWGCPDKLRFTELMNPVEWPEPPILPNVAIRDDTPLNTIGMPYYRDVLLSAWPPHEIFNVNKMPQKIDADILAASATKTGYAPYHKRTPRYCIERTKHTDPPGAVPKFLSQQAKGKGSRNSGDFDDGKLLYGDEARRQFEVPPVFRKVEIKYSKFGVDDFDFEFYNKTRFSGLETHISNSYMNPLLQMYKFTPLLRNLSLRHTATACTKDDCMLCQMGFLFDMLDKANGQNCQATNFLKTFSSLPTADRHGVLEEDSANGELLSSMIQSLNRFLLDQISMDQRTWQNDSRALEEAITIGATKSQRCNICGKESRPLGDTNVTDMIYPQKHNKPVQSFSSLVKQSIQMDTVQKGWCDKCQRYQQQAMRKLVRRLPKIMMFNATTNEKSQTYIREHWSTPGWLPDEIGVLVANGQLSVYQGEDLKIMKERCENLVIFDLVGFVAEIKPEEKRNTHLISFVNVALSSADRTEESNWHIFNDFLVTPVRKEDALDFAPKWKMPSVICFQARDPRNTVDNSWRNHLDTSLLYADYSFGKSLNEPRCKSLEQHEEPKPGTLVALDAEFVSMQNEETEVKADGSRSVVRPSRLGLARVSVLRGEGVDEGVAFLDDYIITREPVVDFLTEFSGIHAGDLDPSTSKHALVPLKVAYKRLWLLLNLGCVFVGHGLLKDFRIINIHVPKEQVVDTVDLFVLRSSQRKLSLRFLAWVILREEIQLDTHDSIEDSYTALRLYKKYLEYNDAGVLESMLNNIQIEGMKTGFKPPPRGLLAEHRIDTPPILQEGRSEANTPQPRGGVPKWLGV
ncbi:ubiquitin carboxyl-terminal hydrolase-domain-containing protein [Tuber borchii]|uniref:PAN2-PAN3 deadenylation complex catalytic subunit PAN2 n=1 Tax=Tuber borchii TaxID=42251 RepID=A0A2T6ZKZ6_TUBBO|nr:ubiquitin carboxyl-terminal hydrolase-domain-containing protein [Tuber borchii]